MGNVNVTIRNCTASEMPLIQQLSLIDSRNPGQNDSDLFFRVDSNGFFIAVNDTNVVGSISAVSYDAGFGFIGLHFVMPEFQNTEVEEKLLEVALQKLGERNIGLNCYESQLNYYTGHGFKPSHKIFTYEGIADGQMPSLDTIVAPFNHPFNLLQELDEECFPYNRKELLQLWLQQSGSMLLAKLVNGKYEGYGLFSPATNNYKISPLVCKNLEAAEHLLSALAGHLEKGTHYRIDLPENNKNAIRLVEKMKMTKVQETIRLYLKNEPNISLQDVYSFINHELG